MIQVASEVAKDLLRKGPSGWYSQAWIERALQSLTRREAEHVAGQLGRRHRLAGGEARAGDEAELELEVEQPLGAEARRPAGSAGGL